MAPEPGGKADKLGNRYESVWTIRHALYVLRGQGESITLEPNGILGEGTEFVYRSNGRTEVHQVKRQNRNANSWSVASLHEKEIWRHLRTHAEAGHDFHFVSTVPARPLQELSDRARNSDGYASFVRHRLTKELETAFKGLSSSKIYGTPQAAWRMLRSLWVEWPDERDIISMNATLAEQVLVGPPATWQPSGWVIFSTTHWAFVSMLRPSPPGSRGTGCGACVCWTAGSWPTR
ncbi:hypothetical protein ACIOD0_25465 [Kitasatospora albolonga]